jgi:hypothetical protein
MSPDYSVTDVPVRSDLERELVAMALRPDPAEMNREMATNCKRAYQERQGACAKSGRNGERREEHRTYDRIREAPQEVQKRRRVTDPARPGERRGEWLSLEATDQVRNAIADEDTREEGSDVVHGFPPTPSLMMTLGRGAP